MKNFLLFIVVSLFALNACAVYTHHQIPYKKYIEAARQFNAVVKIQALDYHGRVKASGSGVWVQNSVGKKFILTASHVLREGASYKVLTSAGAFVVKKVEHFEEFILNRYTKDYAITVSNARTGERMFGVRLNHEPDLQEALRSYGLDLAIAFIDDIPGVKPYQIADKKPVTSFGWAVGYGESGAGGNLGMLTGLIRGSGVRKAFNPEVQPYYHLTFTHILSGQKQVFTLLGSTFHEIKANRLEGQVGPGDSGGPLIYPHANERWQVGGVICSALPRIHTNAFKNEDSFWARLIRKIGKMGESRTPLSYLLWQEGNIYGSEGHYIDLTSPLVQEWINDLNGN
jgi:hypothetical protein